jgi:hypothetical protein
MPRLENPRLKDREDGIVHNAIYLLSGLLNEAAGMGRRIPFPPALRKSTPAGFLNATADYSPGSSVKSNALLNRPSSINRLGFPTSCSRSSALSMLYTTRRLSAQRAG